MASAASGIALAAALLGALGLARTAAAQPHAADHRYVIEAVLDPQRDEVRGRARIDFRNTSRVALHELYFHLYANAFAGPKTVFMREGGATIRGGRLARRGGIDVLKLEIAGGPDLLARADTALVRHDATQMRVPLPAPLAASASIALEVEFRVRLPSLLARMGAASDFFMVAQWFPKLARLEPDGRWASHPYHGLGEFYADFADYDLTVELPAGYVLAAPGALVARDAPHGGWRRERYALRRALDVAFAAQPRLTRTRARAGRVAIEVFAPPGHLALAQRQAALLRTALPALEARLGPYPHDRLVLVLPPAAAVGAAGMEYPGLIVGWSAGLLTRINPAAVALHDLVTAHELAHQWFPMLVASNEPEEPVLDEGLAEWLGLELLRARYGRSSPATRLLGLPLGPFEMTRIMFASVREPPSSLLPAHRYEPLELAPAVYLRPALVFETIARSFGRERFWSVLGGYARAYRYRHPQREQLFAAFDAGYGPGFSERVLRPALEGKPSGTRLRRMNADDPVALRAERLASQGPAWPLAIELERRDGTRTRIAWPPQQPELAIDRRTAAELRGARVDPDHRNLGDRARSDDLRRISPQAPRPPLLARVLLWAQALLGAVGP